MNQMFNKYVSTDGLIHLTPIKFVPTDKHGKLYMPYTADYVASSKKHVVKPIGNTRYSVELIKLSEITQVFPHNIVGVQTSTGHISLPDYLRWIVTNFSQLSTQKLTQVWVLLHSYIQAANELVKEVQTSDEAREKATDASALAPFYQAQAEKNQLINTLVEHGVSSSTIYRILSTDAERTRYLAMAKLYEIDAPQPRQFYYEERNSVSVVGTYAPNSRDSGTDTLCLLSIHDDNPRYNADDYCRATHTVEVTTHRYTAITLRADEDICILQTLMYYNYDKLSGDHAFRAKDTDGSLKTLDLDAAPTSESEYRQWYTKNYTKRVYSYQDGLSGTEEDDYSDTARA